MSAGLKESLSAALNFVEPMHLLVLQVLKLNYLCSDIDDKSGVFMIKDWMIVLNSFHQSKALIGGNYTFPPLSVTVFNGALPLLCGNRKWHFGNESTIHLVTPLIMEECNTIEAKNPNNLIARWVNDDTTPHEDALVEALFDSLNDDFNEIEGDVHDGTVLQMIDRAEAEAAGQARLFA